jgi:hypothetical protein
MQKAWEEFRQTTDPLAVWLDRATVEGPEAWVTKDDLLNAYNRECAKDGRPYLTKKAIAQALKRLRPNITDGQKMVNRKSSTIWKGIGLKSPDDPGGGEPDASTVSTVSTVSSTCYEKEESASEDIGTATQNNREKPFKPFKPSDPGGEATPRGGVRLTTEQAERVQCLIAEGMSAKQARIAVLAPTTRSGAGARYARELMPMLEALRIRRGAV